MAEQVFKLLISGTYRAEENGRIEVKHYNDVTVNLPEDYLQDAQYVLQNYLLPQVLKRKFPDYHSLRESFIEETVPLNKKASFEHLPEDIRVRLYDRAQLERFIKLKKLPIIPGAYPTTQALRDAVLTGLESPDALLRKQKELIKSSQIMSDIFKVNSDLDPQARIEATLVERQTDDTDNTDNTDTVSTPAAEDIDLDALVQETKLALMAKAEALNVQITPRMTKTQMASAIEEEVERRRNADSSLGNGVTITEGDDVFAAL